MKPSGVKTWVEISASAVKKNIRTIISVLPKSTVLLSVVKANAYGHDARIMARLALAAGAQWLGTDWVDDVALLREVAPQTPILLLGYTPHDRIADAIALDARLTVYDLATIRAIGKTNKLARVHIKIETGTTRQGILPQELPALIREIKKFPNIVLEGLSTHYANSEDAHDSSYAMKQLTRFREAVALAEQAWGAPILLKHTACSAAALLYPQTCFTMVRVGIAQYGLWPSQETKKVVMKQHKTFSLTPVLSWKTIIAQIKKVPKGTPVSYGLTLVTKRDTMIAVLPVGYFDGYVRAGSSAVRVLIRDRFAPVLGRICMNMCMVDVTNIPGVRVEDDVILIGATKKNTITADEIAERSNTISYEVVTRIAQHLPRIVAK